MTKLWIYSDGKNATNFKTTKYYHLTNKMLLYKYLLELILIWIPIRYINIPSAQAINEKISSILVKIQQF